jgi:hypothetical protein
LIHKTRHWKEPLLEIAERLRSLKTTDPEHLAGDEAAYAQIERDIFIGFYSVRKLFDTIDVTDAIKFCQFQVSWYPNVRPVRWFNSHRIEELYNLDQPKRLTKSNS